MKQNQPKIYITSDTHFNHKTMIEQQWRKFKSIEDMNEYIIKKWNETINPNDTVYHLGDVALNKKTYYCENIEPRLNGEIIYIKGNHDPQSLTRVQSMVIRFKGKMFELVHNPKDAICVYDYCIHGHIHKSGNHEDIFSSHPRFFNANLEYHKFKPVLLNEILGELNQRQKLLNKKAKV